MAAILHVRGDSEASEVLVVAAGEAKLAASGMSSSGLYRTFRSEI